MKNPIHKGEATHYIQLWKHWEDQKECYVEPVNPIRHLELTLADTILCLSKTIAIWKIYRKNKTL